MLPVQPPGRRFECLAASGSKQSVRSGGTVSTGRDADFSCSERPKLKRFCGRHCWPLEIGRCRKQIVTSLADLALKSERLDVLLKRLEQRGRELNRRTDAARWRAAAFRKVEDFVSARQSLESVLTEDKQDVENLQQLSSLCESMGDLNAAIEFQRRIEAATPSDDGKLRRDDSADSVRRNNRSRCSSGSRGEAVGLIPRIDEGDRSTDRSPGTRRRQTALRTSSHRTTQPLARASKT